MPKTTKNPKVIIAGAGPGEASLITVKAADYLMCAQFILVDRLVNHEIIERFANPDAQIIYVGKHGGKESTPQEEIDVLLVEYGQKDGLTVRLKGGDVALYSQVISEIEALRANGISFEIVPGVTAASGASANLKLPLTARSLAQGVRFLTYYDSDQITNFNWQDLALTTDTLVFYMSSKSLPDLIYKLNQFVKADKPLAIVEQATTPEERILVSSLLLYKEELNGITINQPALVIIGNILKLCQEPSQVNQLTTSFFKEHPYAAGI